MFHFEWFKDYSWNYRSVIGNQTRIKDIKIFHHQMYETCRRLDVIMLVEYLDGLNDQVGGLKFTFE